MNAQIFLIAPIEAKPDTFLSSLSEVLEQAEVSALLLPRGARDDAAYEAYAKTVLPIAQENNCALLLDNTPALAKEIGADGVHMTTGIKAFREALDILKPDMIVGAGALHNRHDAMQKGEAGADYLLFGALTGKIIPDARDDADWWATNFEIPSVFCNPEMELDQPDTAGCEFIGVPDTIWHVADSPAQTLSSLVKRLETPK